MFVCVCVFWGKAVGGVGWGGALFSMIPVARTTPRICQQIAWQALACVSGSSALPGLNVRDHSVRWSPLPETVTSGQASCFPTSVTREASTFPLP